MLPIVHRLEPEHRGCLGPIHTAHKRAWHLQGALEGSPLAASQAAQLPTRPRPTRLHVLGWSSPSSGLSNTRGLGWPVSRPFPPSFLQTPQNLASSAPSPSRSPGATPTAGTRTASVSSPLGLGLGSPQRAGALARGSCLPRPRPRPRPRPPTAQAQSGAGGGAPSPGLALSPLLPKVLLLEPISPPKGARKAIPVSGHPEDASPCFAADILQEILLKEQELLQPEILDDEEDEDEEDEEEDLDADGHCAERDSVLSTGSAASHASTLSLASSQASGPTLSRQLLTSFVSGLSDGVDSGYMEDIEESAYERPRRPGGHERRGHRRPGQKFNRIYKLFKSTSQMVLRRDSRSLEGSPDSGPPLRRAGSLCSPLDSPTLPPSRAQRSRSLPQPKLSPQLPGWLLAPASRHQRRRPFLSGDEDPKASTLRVVVFGSDRISGKVARAYSNLR